MLQKTYSIYADDLNDVQLFVEAGKCHIACWCKKKEDNVLRAFEFFQFEEKAAEDMEALLNSVKLHSRLLAMPVAGTNFFWNTDEVLCVPNNRTDADFLQQNFELLKGGLSNATIAAKALTPCAVAWRIENAKQKATETWFSNAATQHQFAALLPTLEQTGSAIHLFFYPHYFTVCLFKDNRLQYLNTVKFATPEDALYFVLNVMEQYGVEKDVAVYGGGFIDEQSKLYETLYQYLEGFELLKADETRLASEEFKAYPLHYFTPYINYVV